MKKIFFIAAVLVLLAAACNSKQASNAPVVNNTPTAPVSKVDSLADSVIAGVSSEEGKLTAGDDSDLINSDKSIIDSFEGVANENY